MAHATNAPAERESSSLGEKQDRLDGTAEHREGRPNLKEESGYASYRVNLEDGEDHMHEPPVRALHTVAIQTSVFR